MNKFSLGTCSLKRMNKKKLTKEELDALIDEAIVDCYDDECQV